MILWQGCFWSVSTSMMDNTRSVNSRMSVQPLLTGQQYPVIFEQTGHMAFSSAYIHVLIPLNLSQVTEALATAHANILETTRHAYNINEYYYGAQAEQAKAVEHVFNPFNSSEPSLSPLGRLQNLQSTFGQLCEILPSSRGFKLDKALFEAHHTLRPLSGSRSKRAIFLASLIARAVGTFWGFLGRKAIHALLFNVISGELAPNVLLNTGIADAGKQILTNFPSFLEKIKSSMARVKRTHRYPSAADVYPVVNEVVADLELKVAKYINVIQQLHNHRLAVDWLSREDLASMHNAIVEYAQANSLSPLTSAYTDYFQIETSYVREGNDITIILHVPCAAGPEMLSLLRYIPAPIPFKQHRRASPSIAETLQRSNKSGAVYNETFQEALFIHTDEQYIAIGTNGGYKTLTEQELSTCLHKNRVYICDKPNFVRTKLANTCIGSLYDKDETGVKRHCKFERKPFMETVFQVGPNNFVVFSPEQFTARFSCRTGSSTANVAYANRIILDSGCSLELQNHLLHSTNHFTLHDDTEISTWDWDPLTAPAASLTDFTHVVEEVNEIRSSEWFKERIDDHFQKDFLPDHSPLEKIIIMMASIVSMIVAGVITYLMKFVKSWLEVKYKQWLTTVAENHANRQDHVPLVPTPAPPPRQDQRQAHFHRADSRVNLEMPRTQL